MRPPGYEPGELPTAPLRDIINQLTSELRVQRYTLISIRQNYQHVFFQEPYNIDIYQQKVSVFIKPFIIHNTKLKVS